MKVIGSGEISNIHRFSIHSGPTKKKTTTKKKPFTPFTKTKKLRKILTLAVVQEM